MKQINSEVSLLMFSLNGIDESVRLKSRPTCPFISISVYSMKLENPNIQSIYIYSLSFQWFIVYQFRLIFVIKTSMLSCLDFHFLDELTSILSPCCVFVSDVCFLEKMDSWILFFFLIH